MIRRRFPLVFSASWALAAILCAGCDGGFVNTAARTSLASFVTDILSTAVNDTIGPNND